MHYPFTIRYMLLCLGTKFSLGNHSRCQVAKAWKLQVLLSSNYYSSHRWHKPHISTSFLYYSISRESYKDNMWSFGTNHTAWSIHQDLIYLLFPMFECDCYEADKPNLSHAFHLYVYKCDIYLILQIFITVVDQVVVILSVSTLRGGCVLWCNIRKYIYHMVWKPKDHQLTPYYDF
jgi:hypothetical protein